MRVALISTIEALSDGPSGNIVNRRAFNVIAGQTIAERQLRLALSFGCERIACLADAMPPEIIALQHIAERAGAKFHTVRRHGELAALVTATDDVLAFADGLLPDNAVVEAMAGNGRSVAVFPVDVALDAGFERIDRDWGWGGVMLLPGHLIERLTDLPSDSEPVAALLRIALQSQVKITELDVALLSEKRWALAEDLERAAELETAWLSRRITPAGLLTPTRAITDRLSLKFASSWLSKGVGGLKLGIGSLAVISVSAVAGWFIGPVYGLVGVGLAALLMNLAGSVSLMETDKSKGSGESKLLSSAGIAIDAAIVAAIALLAEPDLRFSTIFAGIMMIGLLRLVSNLDSSNLVKILADRVVLTVVLVAAISFNVPLEAMQTISLVSLGTLLLHYRAFRLTQV